MRVKTDSRRQAILDIATEVFREVGYGRASMAMIAARVGGSKSTLYNYFKSKDELFATVMMEAMEERGQNVISLLDPALDDHRDVLCRFGEALLALVTSDDALAIMRTAVAEGANSSLGAELYKRGPLRGLLVIADYIEHLQARGVLRQGSPQIAAGHLKGMLEAGVFEPMLFGAPTDFEPCSAVVAAVDAFLRAYAPQAGE